MGTPCPGRGPPFAPTAAGPGGSVPALARLPRAPPPRGRGEGGVAVAEGEGRRRASEGEAFKIPLWRDKQRSHFRTGISALGLASFPHSRDGH